MRVIINIDVPDLDAAVTFYSAALGLRLNRLLGEDVAELAGSTTVLYLLRHPAGSHPVKGLHYERDYARHWTPVHMDFVVEDVVQAAKRAEAAGALRESECVEWMGSKCISFADPFGHGFCLIEFATGTYRSETI